MPQRTNDYQKLVELIHSLFAPQNAKVTASAMVMSASGQEREVDVLVEYETELYPVRIAVEAKDLSRAIETTTLEQYIGKYNSQGGVTVDKVIIVAKSFARTASDRARSLGFELHTLKSLASSEPGEFSKPRQDNPGEWWVSKQPNGKKVSLTLFDSSGQQLNDAYLTGRMTLRKMHLSLGSPISWASIVVNSYLGEQLNQLYKDHAGESIHFIAEIGFANHTIEVAGFRAVGLRKIVLDFGENMRFPDMQTTFSELTTGLGKAKTIVHETGQGKNATLHLVYEDAKGSPSKVHLHAEATEKVREPLEVKKVVLTIDSDAMSASTLGNLIKEASDSW
jgi:hypothetical protein